MSGCDDLPALIDRLTKQHFPESSNGTRQKFVKELLQKVQILKRERTFSIDSDDDGVKDEETQTVEINHEVPHVVKQNSPDEEKDILNQLLNGKLAHRNLEKQCQPSQAVAIRRKYLRQAKDLNLDGLPFQEYDYKDVNGACCENLIGYTPVPTGIVGPLTVNGEDLYIPMATTEGALIASTNRGCKALVNGVKSIISDDKMTRAPVLNFQNITDAVYFKEWLDRPEVFAKIKSHFESTSRFCKLKKIDTTLNGSHVFLRFEATTGDAMGMNMVSKATAAALEFIEKCDESFKDKFKVISLSGNMCVDKKASALNWIKGRGKSLISEAFIPSSVVQNVLKCHPKLLVELSNAKLNVGSSSSVSIGGANAHSANVVSAMFIATGQDAAQVVSSSMCSTEISLTESDDLRIICTMNCLEVGTVGGGTILGPQHGMLKMLGCAGSHATEPGNNAKRLAKIICATVLAGELSLLAAQCSGDLVRSHMKLNRSSIFKHLPQKSTEEKSNFLGVVTEGSKLVIKKITANKYHEQIPCSSML